jgi:hypothetical protein
MIRLLATMMMLFTHHAHAQAPAEWQAAAQVVINEYERDTPLANKPWTGAELSQGMQLARAWRQHNNGNIENTLSEYLTFALLCRQPGCAGSTIEGQGYLAVAQQVRNVKAQMGGAYALASSAHAWLGSLADPTGAAAKNAVLWNKDLDVAAADFAISNIYALAWLLARNRPTPAEQAATFSRFALFVQERGWIGTRCLDISKVATVIGAPPRVESCK